MKFVDKAALAAFIYILIVAASILIGHTIEQRQRQEQNALEILPYLIDHYWYLEYRANNTTDPSAVEQYRQSQQAQLQEIHALAEPLGDRLPDHYQQFLDDHPVNP